MTTEQTQKLVTITSKAAEKIKEFMAEEEGKPQFLRIYVQGGGCSGLSYGMGFEKEAEEDDSIIEESDINNSDDKSNLLNNGNSPLSDANNDTESIDNNEGGKVIISDEEDIIDKNDSINLNESNHKSQVN